MGDMGIALKIDKDSFQYWFYSDARRDREPSYPLSGKVAVRGEHDPFETGGAGLSLRKAVAPGHLQNHICLLAEQHFQTYMKTGKLDESRLLFKVKAEDILNKNQPRSMTQSASKRDG